MHLYFVGGCSVLIRRSSTTGIKVLRLREVQLLDKNGAAINGSALTATLLAMDSQGTAVAADASACFDGQRPAPTNPWAPVTFCEAAAAANSQGLPVLKASIDCAVGLSGVRIFNGQQSQSDTSPNADMTSFELVISWRGVDSIAGGAASPVFDVARLEYYFPIAGAPLA